MSIPGFSLQGHFPTVMETQNFFLSPVARRDVLIHRANKRTAGEILSGTIWKWIDWGKSIRICAH